MLYKIQLMLMKKVINNNKILVKKNLQKYKNKKGVYILIN